MALKAQIDETTFNGLPDALKSEYVSRDGAYHLDIEGAEDTGALRRARDREKERAAQLEKERNELKDKLSSFEDNNARKTGDIQALDESWKKKLGETEAQYQTRIGKLETHIQTQLVDNVALQLATRISNSPELIMPHIKSRLSADLSGDSPVTRVLGPDGKISALTVEDLQKEFVADKRFSAIIIGSKASGGGAGSNGFDKRGGGAGRDNNNSDVNIAKMHPRDLAARIKAQRGE